MVVAAIALWATLMGAACADEASCPQTQRGAALKTATLFDGPPSEHADLEADSFQEIKGVGVSEWDVAYIFQAGRRLYLKCEYGADIPVVILEPEPSISKCVFLSQQAGKVSLTCNAH